MEMNDLLGVSKSVSKLTETVSAGVGKLYEPIHVRRMAKAKAYEIAAIGSAILQNALPMDYKAGEISCNVSEDKEFVKRAWERFLFQELKKQSNIERIIDGAYAELEHEVEVSDNPVDADWISHFFDDVGNVSTEEMQKIWSRVLAGEVKQPGRFSLRTLNILKTMTAKEAMLFEKISSIALGFLYGDYGYTGISCKKEFLQSCNISYEDIRSLNMCGMLDVTHSCLAGSQKDVSIENRCDQNIIASNEYAIFYDTKEEYTSDSTTRIPYLMPPFELYLFTQSGIELYWLLEKKISLDAIKKYCDICVHSKYVENIRIYKILSWGEQEFHEDRSHNYYIESDASNG